LTQKLKRQRFRAGNNKSTACQPSVTANNNDAIVILSRVGQAEQLRIYYLQMAHKYSVTGKHTRWMDIPLILYMLLSWKF